LKKKNLFVTLLAIILFVVNVSADLTLAQKKQPRKSAPQKKTTAPESQKKSSVPQDAEAWRKQPPQPAPASPFKLPALREVKLDNGLALVLIENHRVPMVTISLGISVGGIHDPLNQTGVAEATAALLTDGAGNRSSQQLSRDVETLGGQLSAFANDDYTEINAAVISENLQPMLELFGDVVLRPTFPEEEVALYKKNRVESLTVQHQEPSFLVSERFYQALYGAHPYAISAPKAEDVARLDRAKIEGFYQANYRPNDSTLVITGDFDVTKIEAKLRAMFADWKTAKTLQTNFPAIVDVTKRRIYLIDRPGSEQADFRIGNLAVARTDKDYFALLVANAILGDGTGSRLFLNIREKKGYTYDVSSSVNAPRMRGTFFGSSETRTEVALPAIREMLVEFERIRNEKVTEKDLQNAKNYLNGSFSLSLSMQGGVTGAIAQTRMLGLTADYLENYRGRIEAVTAEQVQEAARKHIRTDNATIVVVGDAVKLRKQLATLGSVEMFNVEGKPVK
jgi:zinc protease